MRKNILAPSVYAADLLNLKQELDFLKSKNVNHLHFDVMDGSFVPVISIGQLLFEKVKSNFDFEIDVHLMGNNIMNFVKNINLSDVACMTIHFEADDFEEAFAYLTTQDVKLGVAINPATDVSVLDKYLDKLDMVLVMSVVPGKSGQSFIDISDKIKYLRNEKSFANHIQVDGGVNDKTLPICKEAGANHFVVGSYIFNNHENINNILELLD